MNRYIYRCFDCNARFPAKDIEPFSHYLCPNCGKAEKNRPLKGVLQVDYDYAVLRREISRERFLEFPCGEFWHYPQLWPLDYQQANGQTSIKKIALKELSKLSMNAFPLLEYKSGEQRLLFFDDTRNPTLSYKDRASVLVAVKAMQLGINEIAAASTGNAGSSLAGICARLGLSAHLFVPASIPEAKRLQIQAFGATLYLVQGDYDQAFDLSLEISQKKGWYNRNTAFNPLTIEGKKSAAYDIFIASKGNIPDFIFIPVGDGVILAGLYKGFWELMELGWIEKLPRLLAVQAQGSAALVRYLESGDFEYQPAETVADSISAGAPRNLYMAAHAVKESNGRAISVQDKEILKAQQFIARQTGLLIEPAAAASLAGYWRMKPELPPQSQVLLMLTGNGLKDMDSLKAWNPLPKAHTPQQWENRIK